MITTLPRRYIPPTPSLQCQVQIVIFAVVVAVVTVVAVVATRVVDEVEVEVGATAQDFEAGEAEDEAEGLQWRFVRQSSSLCLINSD